MKKSLANLNDVRDAVFALRNERWEYLLALAVTVVITILFIISFFTNLIEVTQLGISSQRNISSLKQYQHTLKDGISTNTVKVAETELFGDMPTATANRSSGKYQLLGLEYSYKNPDKGFAIISDRGGPEGIYRIGDKLPDGSKVQRIEPDGVTIQRMGKRTKLVMDWSDSTSTSNITTATPNSLSNAAKPAKTTGPKTISKPNPEAAKRIDELRKRYWGNPDVQRYIRGGAYE